jgi:hypothetical protein
MTATIVAKNAFLRSDGLFFIAADTATGKVQRGDFLIVPLEGSQSFRAPIDLIIFIATHDGNQQSLVFKGLNAGTIDFLKSAVVPGMTLSIEREGN